MSFVNVSAARPLLRLFLVLPLLALGPGSASAQRVKSKVKPTVAGAKVKTWRAGNTQFTHETLRRGKNGPVLHWRRSAKKVGSSKATVVGKTWSTPFKGRTKTYADGSSRSSVTQFLSNGKTRELRSASSHDGNSSMTRISQGGKLQREISTFQQGGEQVTKIRTFDAHGKPKADSASKGR